MLIVGYEQAIRNSSEARVALSHMLLAPNIRHPDTTEPSPLVMAGRRTDAMFSVNGLNFLSGIDLLRYAGKLALRKSQFLLCSVLLSFFQKIPNNGVSDLGQRTGPHNAVECLLAAVNAKQAG